MATTPLRLTDTAAATSTIVLQEGRFLVTTPSKRLYMGRNVMIKDLVAEEDYWVHKSEVGDGGGGGDVDWGDIGGTLSSQTDLQTALGGKAGCTVPVLIEEDPSGIGFKITVNGTAFIVSGIIAP